MARTIKIKAGVEAVSGRLVGSGARGILLAHGAGTDQDHPTIVATRDALAKGGFTVLTFNYAYSEAGRSTPDSQPRLLALHRAAWERLAEQAPEGQTLAGRSMGGRMGTYLAAEGLAIEAVVLYGYPLHPPGRPEKLRADHLPSVRVPMLFFQGDRDPLSNGPLFDQYVRPLPTVTVVDLPADHSLGGVKAAPMLAARTVSWLLEMPGRARPV